MRQALAFLAGLASACFSPGFSDSQVTCESGICPPGLVCVDGECRSSIGATPDAAFVTPDADVATVDAAGADAAPAVAIFINVNGPDHSGVDFPGDWVADQGGGGVCDSSEGGGAGNAIVGTVDDPLFSAVMFGDPLRCALGQGLPPGDYVVTLLFGEVFFGPGCVGAGGIGSRVFDTLIEGNVVDTDLDPFATGNGCVRDQNDADAAPFAKTFRVTVNDGEVNVRFNASAGSALVSAISVETAP